MKKQLLLKVITLMALSFVAVSVYADVLEPQRTQGLIAPAPQGVHNLVLLKGSGKFVSAEITKQGGTNDLTFVILDIDGRNVVNVSIAALKNSGLTQNNPYGLVLMQPAGNIKTFTIGFSAPFVFASDLKLSVDVKETGVAQILANVIHGK